MSVRTFPMFRDDGKYIVSDEPVFPAHAFHKAPHVVAYGIDDDELRDFVVTACNTHSAIKAEGARLTKARADLAEAQLRELTGEPRPAEFGFYAGLALDKLSVGPLPTFDAALDAARHEHGASKSIFVVEAKPAPVETAVFGSVEIDRLLEWIEDVNAAPGGRDAVLPPIQRHHEDDLARRLNAAVRQWMTANGIKLITASLGEAKSHHVVIPHEVDSVTTRPVSIPAGIIATGQLAPGQGVKFAAHGNVVLTLADEVDPFPAKAGGDPIPLADLIRIACCDACADPVLCGNQGCATALAADRSMVWVRGSDGKTPKLVEYVTAVPVRVEDDFPAWKRDIESVKTSTPAGPHTGDMNAMLDDIGSASC